MTANVNFIGDSITNHIGTPSNFFGARAVAWANTGVAGNTSADVLARVGDDVNAAATPVCHLLIGINDIAVYLTPIATIKTNITNILANLTGRGIIPVLGAVLPLRSGTLGADTYKPTIEALNAWLAASGYLFVDYYTAFQGADSYGNRALYQDNVHPNEIGTGLITAMAGNALFGGTTYTRTNIDRDVPATSGETVVLFSSYQGSLYVPRNWTLRVGSVGYTGTGMTDNQIDACARTQAGIA